MVVELKERSRLAAQNENIVGTLTPAPLFLRSLAALMESMVFMALSIPVVFLLPSIVSKMDAATVAPSLPGFFFMEGLVPGISFPFFCMSSSHALQSWGAAAALKAMPFVGGGVADVDQYAGIYLGAAKIAGGGDTTSVVWTAVLAGLLLLNLLYHSVMEASPTQGTIGKMVIGLKVTTLDGRRPSLLQTLARNIIRLLSMIILFGGYFMIEKTARKQALHDQLSGCLVVSRS